MTRSCICEHAADNSTITVRSRKGQPGVTFSWEGGSNDKGSEGWTASMVAARKFFQGRGEEVSPLDQRREHKLERNGSYVTRVRII